MTMNFANLPFFAIYRNRQAGLNLLEYLTQIGKQPGKIAMVFNTEEERLEGEKDFSQFVQHDDCKLICVCPNNNFICGTRPTHLILWGYSNEDKDMVNLALCCDRRKTQLIMIVDDDRADLP